MTFTKEITFDVTLSGAERASLERITGGKVEKAARLHVRVKVKVNEPSANIAQAESATPQRKAG